MTVQNSYAVYHGEKYAGQVVNLIDSVSRYNGTGDSIPFGYAVVSDGEGKSKLPTASDTALTFDGISMREVNRAYSVGETFGAVDGQDFTAITAAGKVAVVVGMTVAQNDPVYFGVGADVAGKFMNEAGTGTTAAVLLEKAKFLESGVEDDAVWVKFS
ncbi:virion structural protein [Vibrio phage F35 g1]|nr:conserved hypothetical protein [Vibrio phage 115E34-1]